MSRRWSLAVIAASTLISTVALASTGCSKDFNNRFQQSRQFVETLRPEKPGQMRVFAVDGSEFTASQVQWLRGRMRLIDAACVRGDEGRAEQLLSGTRDLLQAHRRSS